MEVVDQQCGYDSRVRNSVCVYRCSPVWGHSEILYIYKVAKLSFEPVRLVDYVVPYIFVGQKQIRAQILCPIVINICVLRRRFP